MTTRITPFLLFVLLTVSAFGQQNILPGEYINSVFLTKTDTARGTSFFANINKKSYLITARHLFRKSVSHGSMVNFAIFREGKWDYLKTTVLLHENPTVDVALLQIMGDKALPDAQNTDLSTVSITQECFFIGFPLGLGADDTKARAINGGRPLPFVKKAMMSAIYETNGIDHFYLDGLNNPGFSGGPLVSSELIKGNYSYRIIGVISQYIGKKETFKTRENEFEFVQNLGIVDAVPLRYVYEIANRK